MKKRRSGGETGILERIQNALGPRPAGGTRTAAGHRFVVLGMGDDAALVKPRPGRELIVTCDWFLEGSHFLRDKHPPDAVGWKCLARAVSDVAAMGGTPRCFLLSLALPANLTGRWLDEFLGGLARAAKRLGCPLAGGDTTASRQVLINVTVVGEAPRGRAVRRSGARPGDLIYVSGRLGEAESGLLRLRDSTGPADRRDPRLRKHLYPDPRLELGLWLREKRLATAMMDLSDGLSSDLRRLCESSGVGAVVRAEKLPLSSIAAPRPRDRKNRNNRNDRDGNDRTELVRLALHGGDDYELLFTVARKNVARVPRSLGGVPLTPIGEITTKREVLVINLPGDLQTDLQARTKPLAPRGWDPFSRSK